MITDLKYVASDGIILKGKLDQEEFMIRFEDILPYWKNATEEDFEHGFAKIIDNKILFTMLINSSQGGIVVLWNAQTRKIEHISEGSYIVALDMKDGYIYSLLDVYNFVTKSNLQLWRVPIGCMDAWDEGEQLKTTPLPPSPTFRTFDYGNYAIKKQDEYIKIKLGNEVYPVQLL